MFRSGSRRFAIISANGAFPARRRSGGPNRRKNLPRKNRRRRSRPRKNRKTRRNRGARIRIKSSLTNSYSDQQTVEEPICQYSGAAAGLLGKRSPCLAEKRRARPLALKRNDRSRKRK